MNRLFVSFVLITTSVVAYSQQADLVPSVASSGDIHITKRTLTDWSDLSRYEKDNATLAPPLPSEKRVVFFGSSTTDNWGRKFDSVFFPGKPYVNRGISGETTPQMLLRFQQDVVALKPAAVVFLGGTNDVAGNSGPMTLKMTEDNISSMAAVAQVNGIKFILASQLPVKYFPWNKVLHPESELLALSAWEKLFAADNDLGYIDYFSVLAGPDGGFLPGLSPDGVHPNKKGYEIMAPSAEAAIRHVLNTHE